MGGSKLLLLPVFFQLIYHKFGDIQDTQQDKDKASCQLPKGGRQQSGKPGSKTYGKAGSQQRNGADNQILPEFDGCAPDAEGHAYQKSV